MPAVLEILEKFVWQFFTLFSEMAPFLLLGFLLAGILHVWVPNHLYVPKISHFACVGAESFICAENL